MPHLVMGMADSDGVARKRVGNSYLTARSLSKNISQSKAAPDRTQIHEVVKKRPLVHPSKPKKGIPAPKGASTLIVHRKRRQPQGVRSEKTIKGRCTPSRHRTTDEEEIVIAGNTRVREWDGKNQTLGKKRLLLSRSNTGRRRRVAR